MQKYRLISRQGEGTFSEVFKAQSVKTGRYTAIKCMKNKFDSIEQVRASAVTLRLVGAPPSTPWWRATNLWTAVLNALTFVYRVCVAAVRSARPTGQQLA